MAQPAATASRSATYALTAGLLSAAAALAVLALAEANLVPFNQIGGAILALAAAGALGPLAHARLEPHPAWRVAGAALGITLIALIGVYAFRNDHDVGRLTAAVEGLILFGGAALIGAIPALLLAPRFARR
jgi:hypothetical protein